MNTRTRNTILAATPAVAITIALAVVGILYAGEAPWTHYLDVTLFYLLSLWYCAYRICGRVYKGRPWYPGVGVFALTVASTVPIINIGLELWWALWGSNDGRR